MSDTAVLVIDMLNAYRHEDAELSVPNVADIVEAALNGERPDRGPAPDADRSGHRTKNMQAEIVPA